MSYRLIWFQHFHKAAGSSVVEAAAANGEIFWPTNLNGNPTDSRGNQLEIWTYTDAELSEFVDQCEAKRVSFVATEWGMPNVDVLANDERVVLVTCIRDPLARYVSNFYYDLHNGYTDARSLHEYRNTRHRLFTMDNYYCRILGQCASSHLRLTEQDFDRAQRNLAVFDCVVTPDSSLSSLARKCGWTQEIGHSNRNQVDFRTLFSLLVRLRWKLLYLRLWFRKKQPQESFAHEYAELNQWDYQLLEQANARVG